MDKRNATSTVAKALAVMTVLMLLFLVFRSIGFRDILHTIQGTERSSIWAAALLYFAVFLLWSFRLQLMMKREERESITAIFPIYMAGVFGNIITPGARVGGEPICTYYMWKAFGGEKSKHLGVVLVNKLGGSAVFIVFVLLSVSFVALHIPLSLASKVVLEGATVLIVLVAVSAFLVHKHIGAHSALVSKILNGLYNISLLSFIRRRFHTYQLFENYAIRKLDDIFSPMGRAATSPKAIAKLVVISSIAWILFCLAHYVLFNSLGSGVGFFGVLIIVTVSTFCGDISFSPGGAGFMEATMIGLCAAFGVDQRTAAAVTLISRGIYYFYGLGVGGLSLAVLACLYGRRRQTRGAEADESRTAT